MDVNWSNLLSGSIGGLLVWILTVSYSILKERRNKPYLEIDFYKRDDGEKYIHVRDIPQREGRLKGIAVGQPSKEYQCKTRQLSLIVKNIGKVHAKNCIAKLTILKAQNSHLKEEPLQVILGWRRNYLIGRDMETPVTIYKGDEEELHLLGIYYFVTPDGEEIKLGTKVEKCPVYLFSDFPDLRDIKFGLVTPYIFHYNFQPNTKYILKVTVYPENGDPTSETFELYWNGGITEEDLKKAVKLKKKVK
jgi:hypothetical protein